MFNQLRRAPSWVLGAIVFFSLLLPSKLIAQQEAQTGPAVAPSAPAKTGDKDAPPIGQQSSPHNDRILWALPNFLTVENARTVPPLTAGQKFKLVARSTFDPAEYPFVAVVAALNQASNTDPAFGQGFRGYAKRYGTAFADTTIGNLGTGAVFASLLRQDPRYYQMGKGGFLHRAAYAACRIFVTRSDSGQKEFNFSEFLGNGMAAAISNSYHPAPRTLTKSVGVWWAQIGWDAVSYELKEFWPDLRRKVHKP
jgi:hypothetical protein